MFRPDLFFSYWIFLWFLFYFFHWTTYNPTFALIVAILENCIMVSFMYKTKIHTVVLFIIAMIVFKIIPLFSINRSIHIRDIVAMILLFFIYCGWLYINGLTLNYPYQVSKDVINNKVEFPFSSVIKSVLKIKQNE
jgi:hypothetical protein